jgi:hypothetical protein
MGWKSPIDKLFINRDWHLRFPLLHTFLMQAIPPGGWGFLNWVRYAQRN